MSTDNAVRHECMIYDGPPSRMLPALVAVIRRNLDAGMRCLYLNSPAMVAGLRSQLYAAGVDVEAAVAGTGLVLASDGAHLVNGRFVIEHMIEALEDAIADATASGFAGLFATGDMTWELGAENDFSTLVAYEYRLEQLFVEQPSLSGICQYHRDLLPKEALRAGAVSHERVFINDTLSRINPYYVRSRSPA